jgi:hypothetical protein
MKLNSLEINIPYLHFSNLSFWVNSLIGKAAFKSKF